MQVVRRQVELPFAEKDWRGLPRPAREAQRSRFLEEDRQRGFDISEAPLLRITLIRMEDAEYQLILSFHHLILDGWSLSLVLREVSALYDALCEGREPELDPSRPYGDYIGWLQQQDLAAAASFWRRVLDGYAGLPPLGVDRSPGALPRGDERYEEQRITIPKATTAALQALARRHQVTLNTAIQAAWAVLLSRYTRERDVVFGATFSGRPPALPGVESMVGLFINTLPVRVEVRGDAPVAALLKELQRRHSEIAQYEYTPLFEVREYSAVARGIPLFETLLVFENYPAAESSQDEGVAAGHVDVIERVNYPLAVVVSPGDELWIRLMYTRPRFDPPAITRMLGHLRTLLEGMAESRASRVSELPLLAEPERRQLLVDWNNTAAEYPRNTCIHTLFEEQAVRTPDVVAVVFGDSRLTYAELNRRANQVAHRLRKLGAGQETLTGLCMERSAEMIVAMLGILKSGGAYVPLDPSYPKERLAFMLEDTRAPLMLTGERLSAKLPEYTGKLLCLDRDWQALAHESGENPPNEASAENLAYVMYTSGSTGRPKGISVVHRGVVRLVRNTDYITLGASDRVAQISNSSFDAATFEIWGALLNGARLVGFTKEQVLSARAFSVQLRALEISALFITTDLFNQFIDEVPEAFRSIRHVIFGGSVADPRRASDVLRHGPPERLLHAYGPTESTTFATWYLVRKDPAEAGAIPIGRPIANSRAYVLDLDLNPVPIGVPGELYIGGEGLARGYLNRPDLTAERFLRDPFQGDPAARMYKTGDLARWLPDGDIEFLGRLDHQVKVRGFRVELGEIEVVLREHPEVREAAVLAREDAPGDRRLVAYVAGGAPVSELRDFLRGKLPEYMVPSTFVLLNALPLTPNGKVDRLALPAPEGARPQLEQAYVAPRNAVEQVLAGIWAEVLKVERVGVHDDFFELGGHSLLATQVISRVRETFHIELPLRTIFEAPAIAEQACAVERARASGSEVREPSITRVSREQRRINGSAQEGSTS